MIFLFFFKRKKQWITVNQILRYTSRQAFGGKSRLEGAVRRLTQETSARIKMQKKRNSQKGNPNEKRSRPASTFSRENDSFKTSKTNKQHQLNPFHQFLFWRSRQAGCLCFHTRMVFEKEFFFWCSRLIFFRFACFDFILVVGWAPTAAELVRDLDCGSRTSAGGLRAWEWARGALRDPHHSKNI